MRWKIKKTIYYLFSIRFRDVYEIINLIIESLTEQELNILETKYKGETISFRDQILMEYFYQYPITWELKDIRSKIECTLLKHRFLFKVSNVQRVREFFLKNLWREIFLSSSLYDLRHSWNYITRMRTSKTPKSFSKIDYWVKTVFNDFKPNNLWASSRYGHYRGMWLHIGSKQNWESLMYQLVYKPENHYYSGLLVTGFKENYFFTYIWWELIEKMWYSEKVKVSSKDLGSFIREEKIRLQQYKKSGKINILEADSLLRNLIEYIAEKDRKVDLWIYWWRFWFVAPLISLIVWMIVHSLIIKLFDDLSMKIIIG
ncbi:hypothetical protein MHF_0851 [Mycoplasma haemofelis Ohio2]|uniref:Uncharacterized protein n=1 Tax=Mycoplasma haemofelis (strain Ohio2) TaxID=859194 RepID=F6FIR7_MYCHI|nr:hypothetical protein MHF_0851 [Mycoplasma haemofelis Ohio2]